MLACDLRLTTLVPDTVIWPGKNADSSLDLLSWVYCRKINPTLQTHQSSPVKFLHNREIMVKS